MAEPHQPLGLYFEELPVGKELATQGRTITETDLVSFASLTGDSNPMHTDAEYAKASQFGERVAHGMLGLSYAIGLAWQLGFMIGTVIAFTGLEWKFKAPVKIGDTIHVVAKVKQTKAVRSTGGGFVIMEARVLNQRNETVQQGEWSILVKSKP